MSHTKVVVGRTAGGNSKNRRNYCQAFLIGGTFKFISAKRDRKGCMTEPGTRVFKERKYYENDDGTLTRKYVE